jgi:microcystin-dependent protein
MASPFVAEVRVFGFNFPPKGWAFCNGQLLPISQNTALFSLLGTFYGGDGKSTFGLPNMQGNLSISQGQGPGLQDYFIGQSSGSQNVTLLASEMPLHNHSLMTDTADPVDGSSPANAALGKSASTLLYTNATTPLTQMNPAGIGPKGNSLPHNNMMPYLCLNFCIAMQGVYPARP